jgi:hypothetical protein
MYTDLRPSFPPLEFSVKIPAAPKILLSDLRSLTLFVFLPVKKMMKFIKISKQNIPNLCNKMHMKLNKGIKKQEQLKIIQNLKGRTFQKHMGKATCLSKKTGEYTLIKEFMQLLKNLP